MCSTELGGPILGLPQEQTSLYRIARVHELVTRGADTVVVEAVFVHLRVVPLCDHRLPIAAVLWLYT